MIIGLGKLYNFCCGNICSELRNNNMATAQNLYLTFG